jgi:hypothetical protein
MNTNQKTWIVVGTVVLLTLFLTFGTTSSHTQQKGRVNPSPNGTPDFSKYPVADLDAPEPGNSAEGRERALKNKRYDKHPLIIDGLDSTNTAVGSTDAEPEPSVLPVSESKLIVVGTTTDSKAFVSNNRKGVYSEYSLRIQSIIRNDSLHERQVGETISIDRSGGLVRYPKGHKVMYFVNGHGLPEVNARYIFFLTKEGDEENPNYKILTAYQIKDGSIFPLDRFPPFKEFQGMDEKAFVTRIMSKTD